MASSLPSHAAARSTRLLLTLVLLLVSGGANALASQATPAPADDATRVYIGHAAALVAEMPAHWEPDRAAEWDYAGLDGFIGTALPSLDAACAFVAGSAAYSTESEIESITWRDMDACVVTATGDLPRRPVSLVFAHPEVPSPDGSPNWVALTTDAAHFDAITTSISFDLSTVTAAMYLDAALDLLETRSLRRDAIDWPTVRGWAHDSLGSAADSDRYAMAHSGIRIAISALLSAGADEHTYLLPASRVAIFFDDVLETAVYTPPTGAALGHGVGYVAVPGFTGGDELATAFTGDLHAIIAEQATTATCGWSVDLRGNIGGNMYTMLAGLTPLLPPGPLLAFRNVASYEVAVALDASGAITFDDEPAIVTPGVTAGPDARMAGQPVAVLIGPDSSSAGEATAIAFAHREQTRFFGEPTYGIATTPSFFPLLDGSVLSVAAGWMVGPQGAIYPDGLTPDVTVTPSPVVEPLAEDPVVAEASRWLRQQPSCEAPSATPAG